MDKNIAIKAENISKTFRIPHEKITSLRGAFVNMFRKKSYEEFKALDDISFEVKKGEFFGIIGRNGSGKSTLLKILAGIYEPDKVYSVKSRLWSGAKHLTGGKVHIDGMISPFLELGIGFNPELSGRDNIYLNATVLGMTKKQIDKKFDDIVAFSELERFIDQKLKNYSSGMQVRLAFSVSIYANREILLMDEVLAVGDVNFQSKCLEEFNRYKKQGKTVVLVTHDVSVVERYCDRAMLLRNGKIIKIGKAGEVVKQYINDNIHDEEKRLSVSEEKAIKKEKKVMINGIPVINKIATIRGVSLFDTNNINRKTFRTGEKIKVSVSITCLDKMEDPNIGIIIKNMEDKSVFVTNTDLRQIRTGNFEKGIFSVDFVLTNYLSSGSYSVTAALANKVATHLYDWQDNLANFIIINEYNSGGLADFDHEIIINKNI